MALCRQPGPTVTLIVANSLRHGTRAGILNVLGTQVGEAIIITVAGLGLSSLIEAMGHWFDWLRLAGAVPETLQDSIGRRWLDLLPPELAASLDPVTFFQ